MRVERVDLLPFEIPLARPLATARGPVSTRRGWIVRLHGRNGCIGVGEASPHPHAPEEEVVAEASGLSGAAAAVCGADAGRVAEIATCPTVPAWIACGVDVALYDLLARSREVSVVGLLGGARRRVVPVNALLGARGDGALLDEARAVVAAGFTHAKRKAAGDVDATAAEIEALAAAVPELAIRVDANGTWSYASARQAVRRLDLPNVEWIEQPLAPGDVAGLAALRRVSPVPIAADESVRGAADVERLAGRAACDAVVVKLAQVGGLSAGRDVLRVASDAGLGVAVTTGIDTGVGLAAALALAATAPGRLAPCGLATGPLLSRDVVRGALPVGPTKEVLPGPGLGVELDEVALAGLSRGEVRTWTVG